MTLLWLYPKLKLEAGDLNMTVGEFLVCFSEKCHKEDIKQYIIGCLNSAKFSVTREEFEGKTLLTIGAQFDVLAQKVRLVLRSDSEQIVFLKKLFGPSIPLRNKKYYWVENFLFRRKRPVWRKEQQLKTR